MAMLPQILLARSWRLTSKELVVQGKTMRRRLRQRMRQAAILLRRKAKAELRGQGRITLGKSKRSETGSTLVKGQRYRIDAKWKSSELVMFVGMKPKQKAFYGKFLEKGTDVRKTKAGENRGRAPKLPWLKPTLRRYEPEVYRIISKALRTYSSGDSFRRSFVDGGRTNDG